MENNIESYFIAIKEDIEQLRAEMNERFSKQDEVLGTILDIVRLYDEERKDFKATFWEIDRRFKKLEQLGA